MFTAVLLVTMAAPADAPAFVVTNKCPPAFKVANKMPVAPAVATQPPFSPTGTAIGARSPDAAAFSTGSVAIYPMAPTGTNARNVMRSGPIRCVSYG